ncbi:putative cytochrome P450 phenylacetate 2-hydroxylase [Macrophomina phaseolina]|uniref:Cytochrome P450 phenylacetate 2-hydroxylase n=1 Tax=Macrophomina phaseolina TaxID=35725 RepID=A0ABQ8G117_9PEZI|nr:putative cytochrome P450 phenylacetate 2-hydroxylase [Macrophomina phaseolina]
MENLTTLFLIFIFIAGLTTWASKTDIPKVKGLPELPGVPIFGSLFLLGKHHARNCAKLKEKYGDVFQVRLGNRRIIYANSFDAVKELWIHNQSALISRPTFWTFHNVVSETQGVFTLGTSPWSESIKRARKAAATALNRQAVQQYLPLIDLEATSSINELFQNIKDSSEIDPNGYFQRFSINISLTLTFGIRLEGTIQNDTLKEVVEVERQMGNFRGVAHCWQDYVPFLRLWPGYKKLAIEYRARRDEYILSFYNKLKQRIADGTDNPCIAGNVLKDLEAKLQEHELKTICLTMVAAGLDTLPGNINMTIAYLSSPHGQEVQERAYEEITKSYPDEDPWHACLIEEKSEYMRSFVKEVLRYWSTLNMSFTRQSVKPIAYQGATIPAGTPFFMNMWAANHDPTHFSSPMDFIPERFVGVSEAGAGTQHFGYGAGPRMCAGAHLANRELYVIFVRMILAFHVHAASDPRDYPELDTIECNAVPTSMVTQPKPFKVRLVPRDADKLKAWVAGSFEKTAYL